MAQSNKPWSWKQVGEPLLERTVGASTFRLVAEYDTSAEEPAKSLHLRFGRLFGEGSKSYLNNTITFTGANVEAMLQVIPEALEIVEKFKAKLPKPEGQVTKEPAKSSVTTELEDQLARAFNIMTVGSVLAAKQEAPEYAGTKRSRKY